MMVDAVAMDVSSDQMSSRTSKLTCHNDVTSEQKHKLDPRTEQCELSEKTNQIGSACLDNEQRVLGTVVNPFVIDEKSHQVSGNSVIQLPAPPQYDLEKSCQTGEGSSLQQSTIEQDSGYLSNDKSENIRQPGSQNIQNEPIEITEAVTSLLVEDQMQSSPVNMSSANQQLDPPSGDVEKNISSDCLERKSKRLIQMRLRPKDKSTSN